MFISLNIYQSDDDTPAADSLTFLSLYKNFVAKRYLLPKRFNTLFIGFVGTIVGTDTKKALLNY
jgi:hypothetical protein